jgi:hypothetical protein
VEYLDLLAAESTFEVYENCTKKMYQSRRAYSLWDIGRSARLGFVSFGKSID